MGPPVTQGGQTLIRPSAPSCRTPSIFLERQPSSTYGHGEWSMSRGKRRRRRRKARKRLPTKPSGSLSSPASRLDGEREERWKRLRSGARNVAGVTYQVAVSADLLVAGRAARHDHPIVTSVVPEGWEDIDCHLSAGGRVHVQAKERGPESRPLGMAEIAEVIAHAAASVAVDHPVPSDLTLGLVTDGSLGSSLPFTGWSQSVAEVLLAQGEAGLQTMAGLIDRLERVLQAAGLDPALAGELLDRTVLVHRPWHVSTETQNDLEGIYDTPRASAVIAYALVVAELTKAASKQRSTSPSAPSSLTIGDVDRIVADLLGAVDVQSLEEAQRAGVCEPIDYLHESDLTAEQFYAGVDAAPSHISANLDVIRGKELEAILAGLDMRQHVLIAGPSGSGKSTLMWRAGQIVGRGVRTIRVLRVTSDEDVTLLTRHVRREMPTSTSPVLVCADDLGSQSMTMWAEALAQLREISHVLVLSAVRREDFTPGLVGDGVVVEARLSESSAAAMHEHLHQLKIPVVLEIEEAIEKAEGLLMEFLALLTTGQRMRSILATQVSDLASHERGLQRHALRLVSAAHTLGTVLNSAKLGAHLRERAGGDVSTVGDALKVLEGEHLILRDAHGNWHGLHDLRTAILQELLHETPPPTLAETFAEAIPLLDSSARPVALRRAGEQLCQAYLVENRGAEPAPLLAELLELLEPLAVTGRELLVALQQGSESAAEAASLLEAGERLDSVAYVYALLPWLRANRHPTIDVATLARLLYTIRNDDIRMLDFLGGPALNELADSLPLRPTRLAEKVAEGIAGEEVCALSQEVTVDIAVRLLEAAERYVSLTSEQAKSIWQYYVPSLPSPPGQGFDLIGCERRAQLAAVLSELASLRGPAVTEVLGSADDRAADAIATDPCGLSVSFHLEDIRDDQEDDWVAAATRKETWSPDQRLVAEARVYSKAEDDSATSYRPQPGATPGPEEDARRACQRLLDACPELDLAKVSALAANGELPSAGGHSFGEKNIRAGVLRVGVPMRRNVSFQAALARAVAGGTWSDRMRSQAKVVVELMGLLRELPRRFRAFDNTRRRSEWQKRCRSVEERVAELPPRPLDPEDLNLAPSDVPPHSDAQQADESARRKDQAKDALTLIAGCLTQIAGEAPLNESALSGAAARLREAPARLLEARAQGAPVFSGVGDALPTTLDQEATRASSLLLALGSEEIRTLVERAKSDEEVERVIQDAGEQQAHSDRRLVVDRLEFSSVPVLESLSIPDPKPLLGRLDGRRALALVPVASWDECMASLESWTPAEREGANGHLVIAAVDGEDLLPVAVQITGATGESPLPFVDLDDLTRLANETGRHLRTGEVGKMVNEALASLVDWSFWVACRTNRESAWAEPPLPPKTPGDIKSDLLTSKAGLEASHGSVAGNAIEAMCELADLVADEDGSTPGLAARLADTMAGRERGTPDIVLMSIAVEASLEADAYPTSR